MYLVVSLFFLSYSPEGSFSFRGLGVQGFGFKGFRVQGLEVYGFGGVGV